MKEVVLLSQFPELLNECADLLNKQWKRSSSARVQSLEKSFAQLPDSLILIEKSESGNNQLVGHSRLTRVLEDPNGCWIGSVVIREDFRKKGYGKYIMQKTEEYAKALQFTTAYLNTHDQQGFYEHLGYVYCNPVSSVSFAWNGIYPKSFANTASSDFQNKNNIEDLTIDKSCNSVNTDFKATSVQDVIPPPPPPPPLPKKVDNSSNNKLQSNLGQYWMKKQL